MAQTQTWTTPYRVPNTLLSDTEESVVGTQWHQEAYGQLADMLRDVAVRRDATWGVCTQISLIGLLHEDGTNYDPMPDLMVLRAPLPNGNIASVRIDEVEAPLFIAEIASESTKANDLGDKRQAYAALGVAEYVVFDPAGHLLAEPLLAWRLVGGVYRRWAPEADGWWQSTALEVALRPGHPFVRVRDRDGVELAPSGLVRQQMRAAVQQTQDLARRLAAAEQAREEEARRRVELEELVRRLRGHTDLRDGDGNTAT